MPVRRLEASQARNNATEPISSGVPTLLIGVGDLRLVGIEQQARRHRGVDPHGALAGRKHGKVLAHPPRASMPALAMRP
jgi:hypothetical protein